MNSNVETSQGALDTVKLAVALILVLGALAAFYVFADIPKLTRVLGLLAAIGVAGFVALQTEKGRGLLAFISDSHTEVRKVVWPTRQETIQTTFAVMVVVVISAVLLWLFDMLLGVLVKWLIG